MKKITGISLGCLLGIVVFAQPATDRKIIDKLCGCFEVSFKYAETFAPTSDYKFHEREEIGGTAELALPIEVNDKKVVIQHLLIVSPTVIVKHWREEWTYENPVIWKYKGDRTWVKEILPAEEVKGKWTQTVWEVADEPRYQGYSQFVNLDGKIVWQNTTDAPLPRREYTVRSDYNILKRTNRLNIGPGGYLHEQDNQKIVRNQGADKLIVEEKGHNNYKKIDEKECDAARKYWEENKEYWSKVRKVWEDYINASDVISLKEKIDNKLLHEYLLSLASDYKAKKVSKDDIDGRIRAEIERFIIPSDKKLAATR
ncbi:MAG TPA: hypothetical protein PK951_09765 [Chitinophagaceae bacterium]|nr:hypothetical protein [Chitinophagaceae bacterium]HUM65745.1 hypothetical protein [Chitinophagaceae bacterium]